MIPNAQPTVYSQVIYRSLWNIMGFIAVALLGSYLSERLLKTQQELGAIKMLHDNIVNSIRTGLMTLDMEGRIYIVQQGGERDPRAGPEGHHELLSGSRFPDAYSRNNRQRELSADIQSSCGPNAGSAGRTANRYSLA